MRQLNFYISIPITITLLLITFLVKGQDPITMSQYHLYGPVFNPSFTGIDAFPQIQIGSRNHWSGLDENISTNILLFQAGLQKKLPDTYKEYSLHISHPDLYDSLFRQSFTGTNKLKHGIGGFIIYDQFGPYTQFHGKASYALHIAFNKKTELSIGTSVGIVNEQLDLNKINLRDPNDDTYQSLLESGGKNTYINVDGGINLHSKNWYIGYAAKNIINSSIEENIDYSEVSQLMHLMNAGWQTDLNANLTLMPSFLYLIDSQNNAKWDANIKLRYRHDIWTGFSYRNTENIILMVGMILSDKFNISYSYDMNTGTPNLFSKTHEFGLGLLLNNYKNNLPYLW